MGVGLRLRRMSHISSDGSRFLRDDWVSTHRWPQTPRPITIDCNSWPAAVRRYSKTPGSAVFARSMTPKFSSSFRRLDRSVGDIKGTPLRSSLKRVLPAYISRRTSTVQRVHSTWLPSPRGRTGRIRRLASWLESPDLGTECNAAGARPLVQNLEF